MCFGKWLAWASTPLYTTESIQWILADSFFVHQKRSLLMHANWLAKDIW